MCACVTLRMCAQVSLSGPADMRLLSPSGAIILDSGTLNLVATQFVLDRDHTNRILFFPESGLTDPTLDIVLLSGDLRAVLAGRASAWPDVLSLNVAGSPLTSGAPAQAPGVSGVPGQWDPLKPQERPAGPVPATQPELTEMAQVFEDRLTEALLRESTHTHTHTVTHTHGWVRMGIKARVGPMPVMGADMSKV